MRIVAGNFQQVWQHIKYDNQSINQSIIDPAGESMETGS